MTEVIDIDVGGKQFRSTVSTLRKSPLLDCLLHYQEGSGIEVARTSEGLLFVDRSPALFGQILEFLRSGMPSMKFRPASYDEARRLSAEFAYFGLNVGMNCKCPQDAVVSARSDGSNLTLHITAPRHVVTYITGLIREVGYEEPFSFVRKGKAMKFYDIARGDDDSNELDAQDSEEVHHIEYIPFLSPVSIPPYIAKVVGVLKAAGFTEHRRSESSCMGQKHLNARIEPLRASGRDAGTPAGSALKWIHTEFDDESCEEYYVSGWGEFISETVTLKRDIIVTVEEAPAPVRHQNDDKGDDTTEVTEGDRLMQSDGGNVAVSNEIAHNEVVGQSSENVNRVGRNVEHDIVVDGPSESSPNVSEPRELETHPEVGSQDDDRREEPDTPFTQMDVSMPTKPSEPCGYDETEVHEALAANRNDTTHVFGCIVLRLTHHSPEIHKKILEASCLSRSVEVVREAGCDVSPSWANGALLLVPMTRGLVAEERINLKPYHIVARGCDMKAIKDALSELPARRRPMCKEADETAVRISSSREQQCPHLSAVPSSSHAKASNSLPICEGIRVAVERTFVHVELECTESEEMVLLQSARGGSSSFQLREIANPRRFSKSAEPPLQS